MKKANVFRSSSFYMNEGDVLTIILEDESGTPATFTLNVENDDGTTNIEDPPLPPVALDAEGITTSGFTAMWQFGANSLGYYLDVAEDSAFTTFVAGYEDLDVGNVSEYDIVGLDDTATYYYRLRSYNDYGTSTDSNTVSVTTANEVVQDFDGNIYSYVTIGTQQWLVENFRCEHYIDGTAIPFFNLNGYADWFLPSKDELKEMLDELVGFGVGDFHTAFGDAYWSSSEAGGTDAWIMDTFAGVMSSVGKGGARRQRPCRSFTSVSPSYSLRDTGPAGGLIFYKSGDDYLEASPFDVGGVNTFSNISTFLGTTGTAIGTGQANTLAIIAQVGHTLSSASRCNDFSNEYMWTNDTTGAMCYYDNDESTYKSTYGALYNWYAVDNAHGLGITGWRVPDESDFDALIAEVGGVDPYANAGGFLKELGLAHWAAPNTAATDSYGFTSLPAGYRDNSGVFGGMTTRARYGTTTSDVSYYEMRNDYAVFNDETAPAAGFGFAIRLMRDI